MNFYDKYFLITKIRESYLIIFIFVSILTTYILSIGTTLLDSNKYDFVDIIVESCIFIQIFFFIYIHIVYNIDYNKIIKKTEANGLFEKKYKINDSILKHLGKEKTKHSFVNLLFIIPGILYIFLGEYNSSVEEKVRDKDFFYGIGLVVLSIFYSVILYTEDINEYYKYISYNNIILESNEKKESIEVSIIEIKEHLKIFNKTSQFRYRIENAIKLIIQIYTINKESLIRLEHDYELKQLIQSKNQLIEKELREMLFSIINYNNERNDEILKSIQKNIDTINSLRN